MSSYWYLDCSARRRYSTIRSYSARSIVAVLVSNGCAVRLSIGSLRIRPTGQCQPFTKVVIALVSVGIATQGTKARRLTGSVLNQQTVRVRNAWPQLCKGERPQF